MATPDPREVDARAASLLGSGPSIVEASPLETVRASAINPELTAALLEDLIELLARYGAQGMHPADMLLAGAAHLTGHTAMLMRDELLHPDQTQAAIECNRAFYMAGEFQAFVTQRSHCPLAGILVAATMALGLTTGLSELVVRTQAELWEAGNG